MLGRAEDLSHLQTYQTSSVAQTASCMNSGGTVSRVWRWPFSSNAEVKSVWSNIFTSTSSCMACILMKHSVAEQGAEVQGRPPLSSCEQGYLWRLKFNRIGSAGFHLCYSFFTTRVKITPIVSHCFCPVVTLMLFHQTKPFGHDARTNPDLFLTVLTDPDVGVFRSANLLSWTCMWIF